MNYGQHKRKLEDVRFFTLDGILDDDAIYKK